MSYSIGFAGDVMLGRKVDERQRTREPAAVWGDRLERLQSLDAFLINLECCLSTRGTPYTDTHHPFHFRADPGWAVPALEAVGVDYVSLANNHVLDYGEEAFLDTLQALDAAGIVHSGAGRDAEEAFEPAGVPVGELDLAVVSLTDNVREWAAGPETPGVAHVPIDPDNREVRETVADALDAARTHDPDLLVVSLHWGPNMTAGPDRDRRAFGRWLVESGVDLVFGHSAHLFHGVEAHEGGVICYDTGDFVDDYAVDADLRNDRGFLFVLEVDDEGTMERLRLEPIEIRDFAVHAAPDHVARWCRETMQERTERFDPGTEYRDDGDGLVVDLD